MLPILRILPVGGVLLAMLLLVLALNPPAGPQARLTPDGAPVRGAMMDRSQHPEWRQLLMRAAIQRADELNRLRDLAETPADAAPKTAPKVAGLPADRVDSDPDADETGAIAQPPAAAIPIDIGETSSVELPVATPEEKPPVIRTPQRAKRNESRLRRLHSTHHVKAPEKIEIPPPFNLLELLFSGQTTKQSLTVGANTR